MKITHYQVIRSEGLLDLEQQMKDSISNGFQPYGHPFDLFGHVCQAVVKYDEHKSSKVCDHVWEIHQNWNSSELYQACRKCGQRKDPLPSTPTPAPPAMLS